MDINVGQVAAATVTALAPFTPFLTEIGKTGSKKLAQVIGEKGGEAAWNKAQSIWKKIKTANAVM